jgi:ABC-2 type transport system ATP-binding protein
MFEDPGIECQGLVKRFGDFAAVDGVSLEVRSGIYALVGPNGAGKSTLLKILTGLLAPDAGTARICGLDVRRNAIAVRRAIGVLPEDLGLFDSLTIEEHLRLCGPVYGIDAKETRERADALMRVLRLDHARDRFLDQCSHGMRKKTALAMALLHNPRVVFLDEPFEGIDPVSARTIQDLLTSMAKRGVVIFLTSHILSIVDQLASEMVLIRGGRIVWTSATGTPGRSLEEVYFELVETPAAEELPWLGSRQS